MGSEEKSLRSRLSKRNSILRPSPIVSLVGTTEIGSSHLHICISDKEGNVFGGHLKQGSLVGMTAEVAIGELEGLKFSRKLDPETGYDELVVKRG